MRSAGRSNGTSASVLDGADRLALWRRGIERARSTDELLALQRELGPIDEDDPEAENLCYALSAAACCLAGGPPPARDRFTLIRPAPARARAAYRIRGIIGNRLATVVWADGRLYGSLYAVARLERHVNGTSAAVALRGIVAAFDSIREGPTPVR